MSVQSVATPGSPSTAERLPRLRCQHLAVSYDGVPAIYDVGFTVYPGDVVALVGANGAGKSTTLRAISGLVHVETGSIQFEGQELVGRPPHEITGLGIAHVPEGRRLFARLTVQENLLMGSYLPQARQQEQESLAMVLDLFPRLAERLHQRAGTLSGGEQQMLAIARGLMLRPKLLMLDEPSLGLAPILVEAIFETIARIRAEGLTILLVEQNVREALHLADRGYVLQSGEVIAAGTGEELLASDLIRRAYLGL